MTTSVITRTKPTTTRALLTCVALAGPLFTVVALAQAFSRPGFDLTHDPISVLSNGELGWLQIANFVLTGLLTTLGAAGLRRASIGTWTPRLVALGGLGMIAAGIFRMDPANGFPVGTPTGTSATLSWHGDLHMLFGTISFAATIAACFVLGRWFARAGRRGYAFASRIAGTIFTVGVVWSMTGAQAGSLTLCVGVLTGMLWLAYLAARLRAEN